MRSLRSFLKQEPVLVIALALAFVSFLFVPFSSKRVVASIDWKVLSCLACLMLVVQGFKKQHVFSRMADALLGHVHGARSIGFMLVALTFFASMFITNDVALITFVPFTLIVYMGSNMTSAILPVVVLQTVAANIGSALTPVGNPQNLYIYSKYGFSLGVFLKTMFPFVLIGAFLLVILVFVLLNRKQFHPVVEMLQVQKETRRYPTVSVAAIVRYSLLFILSLCSVFSIIPWYLVLAVVTITMLPDRELFAKIDWSLLLTFVGFFLFIGNISSIESLSIWFEQKLNGHVFLTSVLASQILSNVPAALLLSQFTNDGVQLLLGVNAGGCGTLIASLASVISYKYYGQFHREHPELVPGVGRYLFVFSVVNILVLLILCGCHALIW